MIVSAVRPGSGVGTSARRETVCSDTLPRLIRRPPNGNTTRHPDTRRCPGGHSYQRRLVIGSRLLWSGGVAGARGGASRAVGPPMNPDRGAERAVAHHSRPPLSSVTKGKHGLPNPLTPPGERGTLTRSGVSGLVDNIRTRRSSGHAVYRRRVK